MDNNEEGNTNNNHREFGLGRIAPAPATPEISVQAARWIKAKHHVSCLVAFAARVFCKFVAVIFLISSQVCANVHGEYVCAGPSNVDVLGAELADLATRMNTVAWFQMASMTVGHIALLGSLICVPEEKLTRRTLQSISFGVIAMNLVFCSVMLATLYDLQDHPDVEIFELAYILVGTCLALTPFLYYCPSEQYRELVRREY